MSGPFAEREATRGLGIETYNCKRSNSYTGAVDFVDADNNWTAAEYNNATFDNETSRIYSDTYTKSDGTIVDRDQVPVVLRGDDFDALGGGAVTGFAFLCLDLLLHIFDCFQHTIE